MARDLGQAIGAVVREVFQREVEGEPAGVVALERSYDTDAADLWDALFAARTEILSRVAAGVAELLQ